MGHFSACGWLKMYFLLIVSDFITSVSSFLLFCCHAYSCKYFDQIDVSCYKCSHIVMSKSFFPSFPSDKVPFALGTRMQTYVYSNNQPYYISMCSLPKLSNSIALCAYVFYDLLSSSFLCNIRWPKLLSPCLTIFTNPTRKYLILLECRVHYLFKVSSQMYVEVNTCNTPL